ncbi:unnamed protein product [Dicrocoelium dendriticum]|nr:unnamed protein product [Dicrocoelium dendriticum]
MIFLWLVLLIITQLLCRSSGLSSNSPTKPTFYRPQNSGQQLGYEQHHRKPSGNSVQPPFPSTPGLSSVYAYGDPELMALRRGQPDPAMSYTQTRPDVVPPHMQPSRVVQPPMRNDAFGSRENTTAATTTPTTTSPSIRDQIVQMILSKYRSYERPPEGGNATVVTVNMKVLAIFSIDVRTMDYNVDALLRQTWRDRRLSWEEVPAFRNYTENLVSPKLKEQLWLPDLFFRNGKDGYLHKLTLPNYLLRVAPNGNVLYSQKITMRFSCQMHLQTFPMDTQRCHMNFGSYGYTLNELKFVWSADNPMEISSNLQLSEFETPEAFEAEDCSANYSTSTGQYTCLLATFELQRQLGSYLVTTYVPNILIIMVSWLSFWVNVDSAPARVPLGLLSLLGILTQAISVSSTLPRVSYIKATDVWMIFSIIFVIGVLVEYAVALTVLRRKQSESWHEDVRSIVHEELTRWCAVCQQQQLSQLQNAQGLSRGQLEFCEEMELLLTSQMIDDHKDKSKPRRPPGLVESEIDHYSRFLFPACYILYNCFYWIYYLVIVNQS